MTLVGIDKVLAEKKNTHTQNNALHIAVQLPKRRHTGSTEYSIVANQ